MRVRLLLCLGFMLAGCTPVKTSPRSPERAAAGAVTEDETGTKDKSPVDGDMEEDAGSVKPGTPDSMGTPTVDTIEAGSLNVQWIAGAANCNQDNSPPLQVHVYNRNLSILRQNKCLNFEAPFIYLIFGSQKALLLDTGATASAATFPLRVTVENLLTEHYGAAQRAQITLVVAHTHAHGDHRAADGQFNGQPNTVLVGTSQAAVSAFFGVANWPESIVDYNLGGRTLTILPVPGHESASLAIYDAQTGILFTGDSLYPGRLYIQDWAAYRSSMARLRSYAESRAITHILGAHVEMSKTPGQDYPAGSTFQPNEHVLELKKEALLLLDGELKNIGATPMRKVLDEFIITP